VVPNKEFKPYKPVKGDPIDELFAFHLNKAQLNLPIKRLGPGQYMFGSRKILAKIINNKLVIRVGGGYMSADEFIEQYGKIEMMKMLKAQEGGGGGGEGSPRRGSGLMPKHSDGIAVGMGDMKEMMRQQMNNIKTYTEGPVNSTGTFEEKKQGPRGSKVNAKGVDLQSLEEEYTITKKFEGKGSRSPENRERRQTMFADPTKLNVGAMTTRASDRGGRSGSARGSRR